MAEAGTTYVTVLGDMRRFNSDVAKGSTATAQSSGKNFASTFAKFAAVGLAAFGAAKVFTGFIQDAQESARVTRLTENAIKATGGAANVTATQVGDLSTALSNKTAVDDELIQSGANLILTFKNIRNEVGAGNDIFNQTTAAALDLSVAGFGSVESASIQLGKALNDPLKGLSALSRSGVTFTEQQKEQIAVLTESGDLLGAQKIILGEIQSQVGGAAAAAADPIERLKVTMGNLGETVGTFLLPYVEDFARFATSTLIPGVESLFDSFKSGESSGAGFVGAMSDIGAAARDVYGLLRDQLIPAVLDFWQRVVVPASEAISRAVAAAWIVVGPILADLWHWIVEQLVPALLDFWHNVVEPAFLAIGAAVSDAWTKIQPNLQQLWHWVQEVLAPTLLDFWHNVVEPAWATIADIIVVAWGIIRPILGLLWDFVANVLGPAISFLFVSVVLPAFNGIQNAISAAWDFVRPILVAFGDAAGAFGDAFSAVKDVVVGVWDSIVDVFVGGVNAVIGVINGFLDAINWVADAVGFDLTLHIDPVGGTDFSASAAAASGVSGGKQMLASGGRVGGWSPHDRADNIPLMATAGEWVQPVSTVNYYGTDVMEAMRRKDIPREQLQYFGTGGLIEDIMLGQFPTARMTSGYRPGDPGYHGSDNARDFGGPSPGDASFMLMMDQWWGGYYPNSTELIHTAPGAINLNDGSPYTYSSATQADHVDHVHVAMASADLLSGDLADRALQAGGDSLLDQAIGYVRGALASAAQAIADPVMASITSMTDGSSILGVMGAATNTVIQAVIDAIKVEDDKMADSYSAGVVSGVAGEFSANVAIAQAEAAKFGWSTGQQWSDYYALEMGEAGFNNLAQNPTSTAYGIGQFLDSTWGPYGPKTSDPALQSRYMMEYIRDVYGDPSSAYGSWSSRDPHWYDEGGRFYPGTIGGNRDGGIERVLTERQNIAFERLVETLDGRSGGSLPSVVVRVFVGNREITDITRTEIALDKVRTAVDNRRNRR